AWVGKQIGLEVARVAELIDTQPTRTEVGRLVESSWPMGVVRRVPSGEADGTVRAISRRIDVPLDYREPPTETEVAQVKELETRLADLRAEGAPTETIRATNMAVRRAGVNLARKTRRRKG